MAPTPDAPPPLVSALRERFADVERALVEFERRLAAARAHLAGQSERVAQVEAKLRRLEAEVEGYTPGEVLRFATAARETRLREAEAAREVATLEAVADRVRAERAWLSAVVDAIDRRAGPAPPSDSTWSDAGALPDEERETLARHLHDGPVQALASLAFRAAIAEHLLGSDRAQAATEIVRLREEAERAGAEARRLLATLYPMALDDLGLAPALRALAVLGAAEQPGLVAVGGRDRRLDPLDERTLYWATRELLEALLRRGARPTLTVEFLEQAVAIELAYGEAESPGGTPGFDRVKARLEARGGGLTLRTDVGGRAVVRLELPAQPA